MGPTLREGNLGVKSVKFMYFLKNLLLYCQAQIRQTEGKVIMTTKIINFMTPRAGILVLLGRGHISYIAKMHYFFKNLLLNRLDKLRVL